MGYARFPQLVSTRVDPFVRHWRRDSGKHDDHQAGEASVVGMRPNAVQVRSHAEASHVAELALWVVATHVNAPRANVT